MSIRKRNWYHRPLAFFMALSFVCAPAQNVCASEVQEGEQRAEQKEEIQVMINEVNSSPDDWVELINTGSETVDLTGWELRDNSDDHRWQFPEGATLEPGALILVKADTKGQIYDDQEKIYVEGIFDEAIGIGSGDSIRLYTKEGELKDSHSWTEHANIDGDFSASWGRYPDGTGAFVLMPETPGQENSWYAPAVVINEVESNGDATDWVEIYNKGKTAVDLSGWYLYDNDPVGHAADISPVPAGTILEPGAFYVFEQNSHFTFGLGKNDSATVYSASGVVVDSYEWTGHAAGVYARIPDGTGDFVDFETSTKGKANLVVNPVKINEVQSKDPKGGSDWVELANPTDSPLDISGIVMKDNDDAHAYTIPEGTVIPAKGFLVLTEDQFGFGLGKGDSVRLFENDMLLAAVTWEGHTSPTWGLYPDVDGSEYRSTLAETPGEANQFAGIPDLMAWPGPEEVSVSELVFLEDSSGLDFHDGKLYAVDNGTGKFWVLNVALDGTLSFADGFENGKTVNFQTPSAKGPDTEGITVDGDGFVYLAAERDNSNKGVNYNVILKADPQGDESQTAMQEWDLTASLPQVAANTGIEAVEWVANAEVSGKLFDENRNEPFDPANYPKAVSGGVFFVAVEDNGHVYAYVLNSDSTAVQLADIDGKLGGAMALDYDSYEKKLWLGADDGYGNKSAIITLNGAKEPEVVHVLPAAGIDVTRNNEGFAIASPEYTVNGRRPVYHFADGVKEGSLTISYLSCDYSEEPPHENGSGEEGKADTDASKKTEVRFEKLQESDLTLELRQAGFTTAKAIEDALLRQVEAAGGYKAENSLIYDAKLLVSPDGASWAEATAANFPKDGKLNVTLPYPSGTNGKDFDFLVVHMFATSANGKTPGTTETPSVTETEQGIEFVVTGLSPVAVSWKPDGVSGATEQTASPTESAKTTESAKATESAKTTENTGSAGNEENTGNAGSAPKALGGQAPRTGDSSKPYLWLFLLALAGVGIAGSWMYGKKKEEK